MDLMGGGTGCIGSPADLRESLRAFQAAGVDQTVFIQQGGKNRHEHICDSLELFAAAVMPEFKEREAEREREKAAALAPYVEAAFARKRAQPAPVPAPPDEQIASYQAYGLSIAQVDLATLPEANRRRMEVFRKMREIMERTS
jgi:hypothetical protein